MQNLTDNKNYFFVQLSFVLYIDTKKCFNKCIIPKRSQISTIDRLDTREVRDMLNHTYYIILPRQGGKME